MVPVGDRVRISSTPRGPRCPIRATDASGAIIYEDDKPKPNIAPPSALTLACIPITEHVGSEVPCSLELEHSNEPPPAMHATGDECCPCEAELGEASCVDLTERWFSTLLVRDVEDAYNYMD